MLWLLPGGGQGFTVQPQKGMREGQLSHWHLGGVGSQMEGSGERAVLSLAQGWARSMGPTDG